MKPVIDIHSHIFNGKDIPLKGYLWSRKLEGIKKFFSRFLIPLVARCIRGAIDKSEQGLLLDLSLQTAYLFNPKQYREWGRTLSKKVVDITSDYRNTYDKHGIDLYVPLMIDFEYWLKSSKDNEMKEQIDLIYKDIIIPSEGRIHPFVAFDPARELAKEKELPRPNGEPEEYGSLELVKKAVLEQGFIGVKVYNAMGYKPFNNASVDDKRKKAPLLKKKKEYIFKGEEYDEVLDKLYTFCIKEKVPITAHCGMYGSECYNGASFVFGDAKFWREVLDQEKYSDLRLNLAHFGWNQNKKKKKECGYSSDKNWVKDICKMIEEYKYVYTDVSHHRVIQKKKKKYNKNDFVKNYVEMLNDKSRNIAKIKKRLLFGTDWHVLIRVKNYENFKPEYEDVLKQSKFYEGDEIEDFLGGNALEFLGLLPGGKNRDRLENFYRKHRITPPKWFTSIK